MASSPRIDELEKKFIENPRRYFAPLANEYRKAGDVDKAIAICRAHLPQQPGHMSGHIVFGQALFESGQQDEAKGVFEAALALDPENLIALRHLGDIARGRGELTAARGWYQRVLDADPRNAEIASFLQELDQGGQAVEEPEASAVGDDMSSGWGDINPEGSAAQLETVETPQYTPPQRTRVMTPAELHDDRTVETPSMAPPPFAPPEPATVEMQAPTVPKRDSFSDFPELRDSVGALPAFPEAAEAPLPQAEEEGRDSGINAAFADLDGFETTGVSRGGDVFAAPATPTPTSAPMVEHEEEPIMPSRGALPGSPDDGLGLEVMEFVPPSRDEHPARVADDYGDVTNQTPAFGRAALGATPAYGNEAINQPPTPAAFVTETMAELYLQQGFRDEALAVYRQLLQQNPSDMSLRERVDQIEGGARSSMVFAAISDTVADAAEQRQKARSSRTIRSFFGMLASRRAPRATSAAPDAGGGTATEDGEPPADPDTLAAAPEPVADAATWAEEEAPAYEDVPAYQGELPSYESGAPAYDSEAPAYDSEAPSYPNEADQELETAQELEASAPDMGDNGTAAPMVGGAAAPMRIAGTTDMLAGSVDLLFGGAGVRAHDDLAAATLAGVFSESGAPQVPGRPTRAASTELSLDHVFREGQQPKDPRRSSGSFSFDQFFAESAGGKRGSVAGMPAMPEPGEGESEDIEQFNKWLEGLKKK